LGRHIYIYQTEDARQDVNECQKQEQLNGCNMEQFGAAGREKAAEAEAVGRVGAAGCDTTRDKGQLARGLQSQWSTFK
jgi:hypothetical protein